MKRNLVKKLLCVLGLSLPILVSGLVSSCDTNVVGYMTPATSKRAKLEEARVLMDEKEYVKASEILTELKDKEDTDGNDVRLMLAAAKLGESELDVWSIIGNILDSDSDSDSDSGSSGNILDSLSDGLLGTDEEKATKLAALEIAINALQTAPDPTDTKVANTACFLSGIMVVPIITDATTAMTNLQTAMTAASAGNCEGASNLSTALGEVTTNALRFSLVFDTAQNCPFLDLDTSSLDGVSASLNQLSSAADKGCDTIPGAVEAFFPQCIQDAVGIPNLNAAADDDRIDSCELALHCYDPTDCF